MSDVLSCGSYTFGYFEQWTPGVAPPLPFALDAWDANPSPANWPYVTMHDRATRSLHYPINKQTGDDARNEIALVVASCVPGATLMWQPDGMGFPLTCTVLSAAFDTGAQAMSTSAFAAAGVIDLTITFRTTPYWLGPETQLVMGTDEGTSMATSVPFVAAITTVPGDVPALTRYRYTHAQATSMLALALRSNPLATFAAYGDYTGTSDSAAFGGAAHDTNMLTVAAWVGSSHSYSVADKVYVTDILHTYVCTVAHSSGTFATDLAAGKWALSTAGTLIGTPPTIDVAANACDCLVLARVKCAATTAADAACRFVSSVQGSVGPSYSTYGPDVTPITAASGGYDVLNLGVASIPAGRVQAGLSGPAYGVEALDVSQGTGSSTTSWSTLESQTVTVVGTGKLTAVSVYAKAGIVSNAIYCSVYRGGALIATTGQAMVGGSLTLVKMAVGEPPSVIAGDVLTLTFRGNADSFTTPPCGYSSTSVYAGGARAAGGDLRFQTYVAPIVSIGATLGVQAKTTESSKALRLDVVAMLPTNEACIAVTVNSDSGEGIVIDYLSDVEINHDIYVGDATDSGISTVASAQPYGGPPLLRPGANTIVGMAATPGTAAPGNASLVVTYRPRYLLPYSGE